jgi:hypothetical protein
MQVALVGGVKGIEREYKEVFMSEDLKCKVFNTKCPQFDKKIKNCDACIIFTNTVSHKLSKESLKVCKKNDIKFIRVHSSSLNKLKEAVLELKNG